MSFSVTAEFKKMANDGQLLTLDSKEWSCVLDQNNALLWEIKASEEGLQYSQNTYTWFDGESGRENGAFSKIVTGERVVIRFLILKILMRQNLLILRLASSNAR